MQLRFTPKARAQASEADAWWRKHRSAVDLFEEELNAALERIALHPTIRQPHIVGGKEVRRIQMRKTRYHVYYTVDEAQQEIVIHAVWGAVRGKPPPIR